MKFSSRSVLVALTASAVATATAIGCSSDPTPFTDTDAGTTTDSGVKDTGTTVKDSGTPDTAPPATYTISASVVGLKGAGLVLTDKTAGDIPVTAQAGGATQKVVISAKVAAGATFDLSIKSQPSNPTQNCVITGGKGAVVAGDVTSITVNCTDLYTVGGTVVGLSGKDLILENASGGAVDSVTLNMNGQFAFAKPIPAGATYAVSVKQNPTADWQTCTISTAAGDAGADGGGSDGGGTTATGNVTNLVVTCVANKYPVSLKVTGLKGSAAVFQNVLADDLSIAADGTAPFATQVASGQTYDVTVLTQPQTPWQTCVVTNGKAKMLGAAVVLDVACTTNKYKIGGKLTGLQGNGLVLQDNAGDDLTLNGAGANGTFTFATSVASGAPYALTIKTQPNTVNGEVCSVNSSTATGTVGGADVTTLSVVCSTNKKVFVSSVAYSANLGGLAGADAKCQGLADAAGLGGTYKAWLSTNTVTPLTRFTQSTQPYVLVNGTTVFANWTGLTNGAGALAAVNLSEKNAAPPASTGACTPTEAWTLTQPNGSSYNQFGYNDCAAWTSTNNGQNSVTGRTTLTSGGWTGSCSTACTATAPLYCFQQ